MLAAANPTVVARRNRRRSSVDALRRPETGRDVGVIGKSYADLAGLESGEFGQEVPWLILSLSSM
jgi:hypothetical protein